MTDSATDQCDANIVIVDADEGDTFYCHSISETIQNFYKNAQNGSEVRKLIVTPGTYYVRIHPEHPWNPGHHINVSGGPRPQKAVPVEIEMNGVTLLMTDRKKGAVNLSEVYNLHLTGLTLMYAQEALPYTQGTITAIAEDKKSFTVKLHAGYPGSPGHPGVFEMSKGRMVMLFDGKTRLPRTSVFGDMYEHGIEAVPGQEGCYVFQGGYEGAVVGDLIAYPALTGRHCVEVCGDAVCLSNINIHAGPCHAVCETNRGPAGNTYDGIKIVPWPQPIGEEGQLPLVSVSADGIHCGNSKRGPTIRNCVVRNTPDDPIAIHGTFFHVASFAPEQRSITVLNVMGWVQDPQVGDPITCYSYTNEALGSAVVTAVEKTDNCCCEGSTCTLWGQRCQLHTLRASKITLDAWPEAFNSGGENCYLENWGCQGSGFLILNNTLEWTRARGMMLKCCNGSIIGNKCKGQTHAAIKMEPEAAESGWLENIVIQDNVFEDVGYFVNGYGIRIAGVSGSGGKGQCSRNFLIVGNKFIGGNSTPILLDQVDNVVITQNTFEEPFRYPPKGGYNQRNGDSALIYATDSNNIRIMNNHVGTLGQHANHNKLWACDPKTVTNWVVLEREHRPPPPQAPPTPEPVQATLPVETA